MVKSNSCCRTVSCFVIIIWSEWKSCSLSKPSGTGIECCDEVYWLNERSISTATAARCFFARAMAYTAA